MSSRCRLILLLILLGMPLASTSVAQRPPSTDLYLLQLDKQDRPIVPSLNLTRRQAYDNQPRFLADGSGVFYTAQIGSQMEIFRYDLAQRRSAQVTNTKESEYSAESIPGAAEFSVIRVEEDLSQRLWAFQNNGSEARVLFEELKPVGYQAWISPTEVGVFVLGDPPSLQIAVLGSQDSPRQVATHIGRCLRKIPGKRAISFVSKRADIWRIQSYDLDSGEIEEIAPVLEGSEDYAWMPDGSLIMGKGSQVYRRSPESAEWQLFADLSSQDIRQISRLDVDPTGKKIVLVAQHQ